MLSYDMSIILPCSNLVFFYILDILYITGRYIKILYFRKTTELTVHNKFTFLSTKHENNKLSNNISSASNKINKRYIRFVKCPIELKSYINKMFV